MKLLLFIIMGIAAVMLLLYCMALFLNNKRLLVLFRIAMLILILTLIISWIVSIVLGQHFILLLGLALIFIALYINS